MNDIKRSLAARPLVVSTSLSILLHGVVLAAFVFSSVSTITTDRGLTIELIASIVNVESHEKLVVDMQKSLSASVDITTQKKSQTVSGRVEKQLLLSTSEANDLVADDIVKSSLVESKREKKDYVAGDANSVAMIPQSEIAKQQQQVMLQLLHASISEKKEYPYLARRQRREGVATVAFLLNPDGTIEHAQLVSSSRTSSLDRAAMSAVKRIEPFSPAQQYLEHAEEFKVDVVFKLL